MLKLIVGQSIGKKMSAKSKWLDLQRDGKEKQVQVALVIRSRCVTSKYSSVSTETVNSQRPL